MNASPQPKDTPAASREAGDALTLARRINHDLRSPLGAISTMAELLSEVLAKELPKHQSLVAPIVESAAQMHDLIKNITLVLRATYGDGNAPSMTDLDTVLDVATAKVEGARQKAGAQIQTPAEWPSVPGDYDWLVALWVHLLSNAIKHGGPHIEAGWEAAGAGAYRFWVRDDGTGLTPERSKNPFPAFEELHSAPSAGGLGLSVSRRLVELLGGTLSYQRLAGETTEFSFTLPSGTPTHSYVGDAQPANSAAEAALSPAKEITAAEISDLPGHGKENSLRQVLDALFSFVGLLTPDGLVLEANDAALNAASLKPEDVIGKRLADTYWWSYSPEVQRELQTAIETAAAGHVVHYEPKLRITPDLFVLTDFSLSPLINDRGELTHLIISGVDLTRNQEAESALAESELRFRTLANNMSQFAWMADAKGTVFWYNQRWFDYTGTTLESMQSGERYQVHHPDHRERVMTKFEHCVANGEVWEDTFPLRGADGEYRWFLSSAIPVHDASGKVVQWFGTNTDVTDQLATEEALRRASQAKDDFIAVLSHELRTPLNPALLIASEAATRQDLPEAVRADFEVIRSNIEVEARLIDDLLDLTRISRGKLPLVLSTVSADSLVLEAVANVRAEAAGKQVRLHLDLDPGRNFLQGDDVRLRQVLWNVLRNAVKFTPAGGQVTVTTRNTESAYQITVRDTGIGMTAEEIALAFEPFNQGEHATGNDRQRFGGLGLGLAISKMLVEQHGGKITASSKGRQRGTTVMVELPRSSGVPAAVDPAAVEDIPYPHSGSGGPLQLEHPMSILLVEDHEATRQTLAVLLERRGHLVTQADSVGSGYEQAKARSFDLLMSDIGLPDGRGDELMSRIRDLQPDLFGIALSGYGMEADIQRSRNAGFALHLTKPVPLQELDRALRRVNRWRNASTATALVSSLEDPV